MNRVGEVNDYTQWAEDANRGQDSRLASRSHAARVRAARDMQLAGAQVDNDRHHTYYYVPRHDNRSSSAGSYYDSWSRGGRHWPGRYGWDWYDWRNDPRSREHYYFGRTADEVMDDYYAYAMGRHHGFSGRAPRRGDQDMVPRDPRDDQLFWCMELDGDWTLRSYNTIENALRPGYWTSYHGKAVFVRTRE